MQVHIYWRCMYGIISHTAPISSSNPSFIPYRDVIYPSIYSINLLSVISIYLSIYLSIYVYLSIYLSAPLQYLSIYQPHSHIYLSTHLSIHQSIICHIYLSIYLCLSIFLCVSIYLSISPTPISIYFSFCTVCMS